MIRKTIGSTQRLSGGTWLNDPLHDLIVAAHMDGAKWGRKPLRGLAADRAGHPDADGQVAREESCRGEEEGR